MKIAIVNWPINDVGGINTYCENLIKGLRNLDHDPHLYHLTPQGKYAEATHGGAVTPATKRRFTILPGVHLSYADTTCASCTDDYLNKYDLVIFLHPGPHPTKAVKANKYHLNWMRIYKELKVPNLVIFHDANWRKTNAWFEDVSDCVDAALAAQHIFLPSVVDYPSVGPKKWEYFPLDIDAFDKYSKFKSRQPFGILATQWLKWKNHHKFLPHMPDIRIPMRVFGAGMEYHNLAKQQVFNDAFCCDFTREDLPDGVLSNNVPHEYYGYVDYEQLMMNMGEALFSIDLSTKGYTNMTHWEPMACYTLNLVHEDTLANEYCRIPEDCCFTFNWDNVVDVINELHPQESHVVETVDNAYTFVSDRCHCTYVVDRILKWLEEEDTI